MSLIDWLFGCDEMWMITSDPRGLEDFGGRPKGYDRLGYLTHLAGINLSPKGPLSLRIPAGTSSSLITGPPRTVGRI